MNNFSSKFTSAIEAMTEYRVALEMSARTLSSQLKRFDVYCSEKRPEYESITKELVFDWLTELTEEGTVNVSSHASAIRQLAEYMNAIGQYAYVLPTGFYPYKSGFTAYVFSDSELSALFTAIDSLPNNAKNNEALVAPVLFRLIYTCGLRPNEGRELKRKNIELDTGEIYVTNTKKKKDRLVVMSPDMLNLCREFDDPLSPEREYFFPQLSGKLYIPKQRSGSPHTQKAYKTAIDDLFDFVKEKKKLQFADITFEIINSSTLSEFLDSIEAKGNSIATRNHRLACIRAFYKYVAKIEPLAVPFRAEIMKVPMKKSATSVVINYMSEAEVKSV